MKRRRKQRKTVGYWSFNHGMGEPTTEDRMEIEARTAAILERKLRTPERIAGIQSGRQSTAVFRARGNGARRGGFGVSRD